MMKFDLATLVVRDYDEAIGFYVDVLGFTLSEDSDLGNGKRWVVVRPAAGQSGILLATADDDRQSSAIGNQTGGRVSFFLHTDDFAATHAEWIGKGVRFLESPRVEPYGTVAVFEDLYGNRWDLIQPRT